MTARELTPASAFWGKSGEAAVTASNRTGVSNANVESTDVEIAVMTEGHQVGVLDSPFICSFCHRRFTKKEHLKRHERAHTGTKPFRCTICDRRFSRGDVLNRHVRGHKEATHLGKLSGSESQTPPALGETCGDGYRPVTNSGRVFQTSSDLDGQGAGQSVWPTMNQPTNQLLQQDVSSTLLWPDSEGFFRSLMSGDGMNWDNVWIPQPEPSQNNVNSVETETAKDTPENELAAVEDGHRAVQTINSLLTNTLFNVTLHVELSDLTPRFLDSSLHNFFTKFIPILPVIHQPTFVYRDCSAHLLLNAIALGSLFLGTEDATVKGEALWRLAHTAIATSWSELIGQKRPYDACSGVDLVLTALLSQTYAALSKNRELRMTSQTFYGLSMHWAQYCGLYDVGSYQATIDNLPKEHDPIESKTHAWRSWAARETKIRTLLGLCIVDGVVSQFSGNLVNTGNATKHLPLAATEDVFAADTADRWIRTMKETMSVPQGASRSPIPVTFRDLQFSLGPTGAQPSQIECVSGLLNIKILIEILSSLAIDIDRGNPDPHVATPKHEAVKALVNVRHQICHSQRLSAAEKAIGLLRWHAACLNLDASTPRGARRMCQYYGITQHIFGGSKREETRAIIAERWLRGPNARKCLLHAMEIHKIASAVPLGVIHDTCLPGALFAAATTYSSFALPGISKVVVPASVDWNTVLLHRADDVSENAATSQSKEANDTTVYLRNSVPAQPGGWNTRNLMYELGAIRILLHSLSQHWGVTQEMEEVIRAWEARCGG